ncbi:IFNG protein, partial [Trogon melanurus]|nr:IFNG protein [Trogon melanurus]
MTCQTNSLFILSVIMIYFGHLGKSLNLIQLEDDMDQLKADFEANRSNVADGGPVFTHKLTNWTERNEKRIILSQIVPMYLEILKKADISKAHVRNLAEQLTTLNRSLIDGSNKMQDLMYLSKLQISDLKIQRKAVNEMYSVFQALQESSSFKRKRSQSLKKCRC